MKTHSRYLHSHIEISSTLGLFAPRHDRQPCCFLNGGPCYPGQLHSSRAVRDDLLLCAESEKKKLCQTATHMLLQHLQQTGHKASAKKMQYCQTYVQYLGFTLSHGKRSMTADRVKAVTSVPRPTTQKEMLSLLGMVNYCRQWIPDCSFHDHILRDCCKKRQASSNTVVQRNDCLFKCIKGSADLPHSKVLPVGMPACLRGVAACAIMIRDCEKLTLSHDTILHTNHEVTTIVADTTTQHMQISL